MVTLEEAKAALRVDSDYEDNYISSLIATAGAVCMNTARLSASEWEAIWAYDADGEDQQAVTIRGLEVDGDEVVQIRNLLHNGVLFVVTHLFENREDADHHAMIMSLRNLLSPVREGVV